MTDTAKSETGNDRPSLAEVAEMLNSEHGLAVVSTTRLDGQVLSSVVNCGVMSHQITGQGVTEQDVTRHETVAFVSRGDAARLNHIRRGSSLTVTVRRGWAWRGVTGAATIIGPDDPADGVDTEALRLLLRQVFQAAGGTHDDYDTYDQVMRDERRAAVFVTADRVVGNG